MNSRKWQVGMVAMIVLSGGILATVPFCWRALRLSERRAFFLTLWLAVLQYAWAQIIMGQTGVHDTMVVAFMGGVVMSLIASGAAILAFRPNITTGMATGSEVEG